MFRRFRPKLWLPGRDYIGVIANWIRDGDDSVSNSPDPFINMIQYGKLLEVLPDKVVENLEKARMSRDGRMPMLKAGLGYEECLSSIIVDGAAIASSSAEAKLAPALLIPRNYLQPGGIPGRTLRTRARGRQTTLTTAATMTFRHRIAATDVITGTTICASGAIVMDTVVQTNTMWEFQCDIVSRSVGSAGTVFGMGDADMATAAVTIANQQNKFMGSAGSAAPVAVTWDQTIDQFFQTTAQWSLATAYSIQCHQYVLEAIN